MDVPSTFVFVLQHPQPTSQNRLSLERGISASHRHWNERLEPTKQEKEATEKKQRRGCRVAWFAGRTSFTTRQIAADHHFEHVFRGDRIDAHAITAHRLRLAAILHRLRAAAACHLQAGKPERHDGGGDALEATA
jgi:hypothetical protein